MVCFRAFCKVGIIREALRKVRFYYMETYLLKKRSKGLGCGLDVICCGTEIVVRADRSLGYSIPRGRVGSGIDIGKGEIECGRFKVDMAINRHKKYV